MAIFISYRRADSQDAVGRIYDRLIAAFPADLVFRDLDSLPIGRSFPAALDESIAKASVALIVIGPRWISVSDQSGRRRLDDPADFVRKEVMASLSRGIPVIPTLVSHASMPQEGDLPEPLRPLVSNNGLQVRPDPDFHKDMDRLVRKLESILADSKKVPRGGQERGPLLPIIKATQSLMRSLHLLDLCAKANPLEVPLSQLSHSALDQLGAKDGDFLKLLDAEMTAHREIARTLLQLDHTLNQLVSHSLMEGINTLVEQYIDTCEKFSPGFSDFVRRQSTAGVRFDVAPDLMARHRHEAFRFVTQVVEALTSLALKD